MESCDCDKTSIHDCICPECHQRYLDSLGITQEEYLKPLLMELQTKGKYIGIMHVPDGPLPSAWVDILK